MMDLKTKPTDFKDVRIAVLGAKRSGVMASILFAKKGGKVLLSDSGTVEIEGNLLSELNRLNVEVELGGHTSKVTNSELAILSPGIPNSAPIIQLLVKSEIPIVSEIEAASWFIQNSTIIGVTGSNGKTTTTTLLNEMFKDTNFETYCGGNIGIPLSQLMIDAEKSDSPDKVFILELSSFQLERIVHFHPNISIMLNITPDHMDRYEHNLMHYFAAKLHIAMNQNRNDFYIYNDDDRLLCENLPKNCQTIPAGIFSKSEKPVYADKNSIYLKNGEKLIDRSELFLLGEHNLYNILASLNAALICGISQAHLRDVLKNFKGIEHRLEFITTINGVDFYNDSKATNVDSVNYALKSFARPVIVILGGKDKDSDFSLLIPNLKKYAKEAILVGKAAAKIRTALEGVLPLTDAGYNMEKAVRIAKTKANPGDVVVLSPACASFDMYNNYEHRGKAFKEIVRRFEEEPKSA
ncbi:MAG: UDP-N-acetylmuramoyl-L-alanine--D-glutamate ligase [Candidatus Marinimicrobia bacterium CG08_land_8_20_14_0_20_45_22]|nr:MAG: UDP-N-acetylmuramoyl-L-alanine--D-glutamate ligase [Candidatus Marinimicrobia bacterium CG08_land_8_20_14_0_20_45_22]